jgi:[acyl-carrier-protein] S-malonyltransferase
MLAFTFPGQGSQQPGMGRPWLDHESWELVGDASEAAERDIAHLLLDADADELRATRNAQLATFVLSSVVLDAVERLGIEPALLAGHSLGEYTALTAAGAVSFEDGVHLVVERGEAMQLAADGRPGTMAAILGLDDEQADIACKRTNGDVWVANCNAPGQVVIAGSPEAIEAAGRVARELGAKRVMPLQVSGAFHTPFMSPARDRLLKAIGDCDWRPAIPPVIANVDALPHGDGAEWPALLDAQLTSPVRWRQTLLRLVDDGATILAELGPGTVLTGLAKRIATEARTVAVSTPDGLDSLLEAVGGEPIVTVHHEGEHLFASERLVVSPAAGVFQPGDVALGRDLAVGDIVGTVGLTEVRSPFAGRIQGVLALAGERVMASQPIAWLRTA